MKAGRPQQGPPGMGSGPNGTYDDGDPRGCVDPSSRIESAMSINFTCPYCQNQSNVDARYAGQSGPCATCGKTIQIPEMGEVASAGAKRVGESGPGSIGKMALIAVLGIVLFLGLLVGGVLVAWLLPAYTYNTPGGQTAACSASLKRIGAAMEAYRAEHGTYPPAYVADKEGKPMHSWRVLLLPYLNEHSLFAQYDMNEPWNGPRNSALVSQMPSVYGCPADSAFDYNETSYMVLTGPGTAFNGDKGIVAGNIKDGQAKTILAIEVANSSVNWMEPRDIDATSQGWKINATERGIGSLHAQGGAHALLADGTVYHLRNDVPAEQLRALATVDGGEVVDPAKWSN